MMMEPASDNNTTKRRQPPSVFHAAVPMGRNGDDDLLSLIPDHTTSNGLGLGVDNNNSNNSNNSSSNGNGNNTTATTNDHGIQNFLQLDNGGGSTSGDLTAITSASSSPADHHTNLLFTVNPQDAVSDAIDGGGGDSSANVVMPIPAASPLNVLRTDHTAPTPLMMNVRSRKGRNHHHAPSSSRRRQRRQNKNSNSQHHRNSQLQHGVSASSLGGHGPPQSPSKRLLWWLCCRDRKMVRSTLTCMNIVARALLWCSLLALVAAVVWYSYELKNNGKDPHLIAWFSAGAFVLLGFPISLYGIVMHLSNYNQPETQSYIVRILWMVPIYSIQSWLSLRYNNYAVYIETLRDFYESYVLYSFLQYLIQVLGGEEALILMLKDKSPTRGVHMWGLQWCVKPWLMGQPVRKTYMTNDGETIISATNSPNGAEAIPLTKTLAAETIDSSFHNVDTSQTGTGLGRLSDTTTTAGNSRKMKPLKRVHWTSPFFVKCKFAVIQYVLLKLVCSLAIFVLEKFDVYKEGNFTYRGGYLYICILTNLSQCWALYCLIFFYYATKNELSPINPVGKFLSVKALVFFTWWQSVAISVLYQMDLIPTYQSAASSFFGTSNSNDGLNSNMPTEPDWSVPLSAENASALDEFGGNAFWTASVSSKASVIEYSPEEVAKAMQDYLICIEMFVAAIVHTFVFPHSEYSPEAVEARARALNQKPNKNWNKRLGRKWKDWDNKSSWSNTTRSSRESGADIELPTMYRDHPKSWQKQQINRYEQPLRSRKDSGDEDDLMRDPLDRMNVSDVEHQPLLLEGDDESESSSYTEGEGDDEDADDADFENDDDDSQRRPGQIQSPIRKKNFVSALLDSTIPQDLRDNTVGIIKGDYVVEKKTLLHHAATSDSYDLFSRFPKRKISLGRMSPAANRASGGFEVAGDGKVGENV